MNLQQPIIIGNWKMNQPDLAQWLAQVAHLATMIDLTIGIAPPFTMLKDTHPLPLHIGGQNCHFENSGAHTGDISAAMLASCGAEFCLLGHSERRQNHFETNQQVKQKAVACLAESLLPIICIGETKDEYESKRTNEVLGKQLAESLPDDSGKPASGIVIAYEPVWAIGTGLTPSLDEIAGVHEFIRSKIHVPLLYGGSVKADNVAEIIACPNVDGVLVGGASLEFSDFLALAKNCI